MRLLFVYRSKQAVVFARYPVGVGRLTLLGLVTAALLGGCAWVKLTEAGAAIRVRADNEVGNCQKIGTTTVKTADKVVISRDDRKVIEELQVMARNEAARMQGGPNTIVASTAIEDGRQSFAVYRCP